MSPTDDQSTSDATPAVIRLMKYQARGLLVTALLHSTSRDRFEALVETTAEDRAKSASPEDRPILSRAGSLLLEEATSPNFAIQLATGLIDNLGAVFWIEVSEHLIRDTACKFNAFGEFKRFSSALSFIPELLWDKSVLPSILPGSGDYALDALCRLALEPVRPNARSVFRSKFHGAPQSFQDFGAELLRDKLSGILATLKPQAPFVAGVFSSVAAIASYYAWVIAFDTAIQAGAASVPGVGYFKFVPGRAVNRVDFLADNAFLNLIKINAEKPALPDEIGPPMPAAAA